MMPLGDALSNITALGFDTAPFIYFIERHPRYVDMMRNLFGRVDHGSLTGYTSAVTLTEVLTVPKRQGYREIENAYIDLLTNSRHFILVSIDAAIAEQAAALRGCYALRTPDALQIARPYKRAARALSPTTKPSHASWNCTSWFLMT